MRRPLIAAFIIASATMALATDPGLAQQGQQPQLPLPPGGFKPPPPAPVKPYQPVAVTPPAPLNDPSFVAFRQELGQVVARKNRAAVGKLVVAQGFFWIQDKDVADPHKSGFDNLAKAVGLDAQDDSGWQTLAGFASEPSAAESPQQEGVFCAPGPIPISIRTLWKRSPRRHRPIPPNGVFQIKTAWKCTPRRSLILP